MFSPDRRYKSSVNSNTAFDVARDGRFPLVQPGETRNAATHIDVVLNWSSQLRAGASAK